MDKNEMRGLEEKARAIVASLSELEGETKRQRRMGDQLERGKEAVLEAASSVSAAAEGLAEAAALLRRGTLAEDIDRLDAKVDDVRALADLARDEARKAEGLCAAATGLVSSLEASAKETSDGLDGIRDSCESLLRAIEAAGEESAQRHAELAERLDDLEEVIARIDRNTQKGFGKERPKHAAW